MLAIALKKQTLPHCAIYPKAGVLLNNLAVDICSHLFLFSSPSVLLAMFFYAVLCHQTRSAAIGGRGSHTTDQDWIHYIANVCVSEVLIVGEFINHSRIISHL